MKQKRELVRLLDYKPSAFLAESVHLTFQLAPKCTIVHAKIRLLRKKPNVALVLNGKDLELVNAKINGKNLNQKLLKITPNELKVPSKLIPSDEVVWEATTKINPEDNTSLEGLYLSDGTYCTQCEAEGFRKITYFLDRPDVMSIYSVRIEGDEPILLSNGNLVSSGPGFVEWHDPWPKPSYLFALVAGDLAFLRDTYVTKSGRNVNLRIYAKENQIDQHNKDLIKKF